MKTTGEVLRDAAMAAVWDAADADWKIDAKNALYVVVERGREFTTDQVWEVLDDWGVPRPREPRAMGPIMRRAMRDRVIKRTGGYDRSKRPEAHANPKPQYEGVR